MGTHIERSGWMLLALVYVGLGCADVDVPPPEIESSQGALAKGARSSKTPESAAVMSPKVPASIASVTAHIDPRIARVRMEPLVDLVAAGIIVSGPISAEGPIQSGGGTTSPGHGPTLPQDGRVPGAGTGPGGGTTEPGGTPSIPTEPPPEPRLGVVPMALRNATDAWSFAVAGADELLDVVWDFGDGSPEFRGVYAEHSYAHRPQLEPMSSFKVTARVRYRHRGSVGEQLVKHPLRMPNYAFHLREHGVTLIQTTHHPRFPTRDADGVVSQTVTLWQGEEQPVTIDSVEITKYFRDGSRRVEVASMEKLAGWSVLDPERDRSFPVALDTRADPDVTHVVHRLIGRSEDESPAYGRFTLMIPVRPTSGEARFVDSVELRERIIEARRVLQKPYVTAAEVRAVAAMR